MSPTIAATEPLPTTSAGSCCPPLGVEALDAKGAGQLAIVLKALADPVRLRLLSVLATAADGEVCACDLPAVVDRSQSTVSHHLSQLVAAGLVEREQRGKWAWFRVDEAGLSEVASALTAR